MSGVKVDLKEGQVINTRGFSLRPVAQSFSARLGKRGGLVWNRPYAVQVLEDGEVVQQIPIVDLTRIGQIILWGVFVIFGLVGLVQLFRRSSHNE